MRSRRAPAVAGIVVMLQACASAQHTEPRTEIRLEPPPAAAAAPLPALPPVASDLSIVDAKAPRLSTFTAVNQDVRVVVRELAEKFGLQYRIDPSVHGIVNAAIRDRTLAEVLTAILPQGVAYQIRDGLLTVGPVRVGTRIFSMDYVALSRFSAASTVIQRRMGSVGDVISGVSVADAWEEIRVAIEALVFDAGESSGAGARAAVSPQAGVTPAAPGSRPHSRTSADGRRVIVNPMAGTITVSAYPDQLDQVDTFIRMFESSIQRQVLIEAKIVEVDLHPGVEFGVDWNALIRAGNGSAPVQPTSATASPSTGATFTLYGDPGRITAVLTSLATQGEVRVLSNPRVSALNNQRMVFDVTTGEIVFNVGNVVVPAGRGAAEGAPQVTPTQVNVGVVLDVLPQIGADNTVTMNIRPVVTSVARMAKFKGANGAEMEVPVIDSRGSDTMARLRTGETIIIGGLLQTRRERTRGGVPGLRGIPLLGRLFTTYKDVERKVELVIFLTPTIIAGQPVAAR